MQNKPILFNFILKIKSSCNVTFVPHLYLSSLKYMELLLWGHTKKEKNRQNLLKFGQRYSEDNFSPKYESEINYRS